MEKKSFFQINSSATHQVPGDMLIYSSKKTTFGTADVIGVTIWLGL